MPLFVFGSLRDGDILEIVLGRSLEDVRRVSARLPGFRVARLPDESYPVMLRAECHSVQGELLCGLSEEDFRRIAFFENQEYRFDQCTVELADGGRREALYCTENEVEPGALDPWSLKDWQRRHKPVFMKHTRDYMKLYGTVSSEEADKTWRELTKEPE
ncbi:MAG: gamma-glutamylcyclotransferase family protein [Gammaproteobacteria bacterium]|nr:gamma-glutamylcyclotransferase family protein [Gammaproteobacteria bacterium]